MKGSWSRVILAVSAIALCRAGQVSAQSLDPPARARLWIAGTGGISTYGMWDMNAYIDRLNMASSLHLPSITNGFDLGIEAGTDLDPKVALSLVYERMRAVSTTTSEGKEIALRCPASALAVRGRWLLIERERFGIGVASALGPFWVRGEYGSKSQSNGRITADGLYTEGMGVAELRTQMPFMLTVSLGYHFVRSRDFKLDRTAQIDPASKAQLKIDYSGLSARFGLRLNLI